MASSEFYPKLTRDWKKEREGPVSEEEMKALKEMIRSGGSFEKIADLLMSPGVTVGQDVIDSAWIRGRPEVKNMVLEYLTSNGRRLRDITTTHRAHGYLKRVAETIYGDYWALFQWLLSTNYFLPVSSFSKLLLLICPGLGRIKYLNYFLENFNFPPETVDEALALAKGPPSDAVSDERRQEIIELLEVYIRKTRKNKFDELIRACQGRDMPGLRRLCEEGADYTLDECRCLSVSAWEGNVEAVKYLLALPRIMPSSRSLTWAFWRENWEALELLLEFLYRKGDPREILIPGVEERFFSVWNVIIGDRFRVFQTYLNGRGQTEIDDVLLRACNYGSLKYINYLLERFEFDVDVLAGARRRAWRHYDYRGNQREEVLKLLDGRLERRRDRAP